MKYVSNEKLTEEIILSKEKDELTETAIILLQKIARELNRSLRYKRPDDSKDCVQEAMFNVLRYWRNFNPEHPSANAFSFFTQLIKTGMAKGFKDLNAKSINNISLSEKIYNL